MYYLKTTLIYFLKKSMNLYHLKSIFTEIFIDFRLFIVSYHDIYIALIRVGDYHLF